ncbi:MAG: hypothetical protein ACJ8F1_03790 [Polyangia bacterium]
MRRLSLAAAGVVVLVAIAGQSAAREHASGGPSAVFALIIGVNASPDPDVRPLQYADDDAARYLDLFRALGARTYLLTRLDENTRRLHPQAAAEAQPARREDLQRAVAALARDVAQARARGVRSVLYVIYAGHGDVRDEKPYLTLEDGRLEGPALISEIVGPAAADQNHLIIDACQAYLLAFQRGPGGTRRAVHGFVELEAASRNGRIGYLLSSSATGETHEWAGFEAGVFSHEVRSGLYGAADADGDGVVTYTELAAFVTRANADIVSARFRPQIVARAPAGGDALLDLRSRAGRQMRFDGPDADAHYLLEDAQGVRLLDFHGGAHAPVHLVRPAVVGPLYLRRVADGAERTIQPGDAVVQLDALPVEPARAAVRGAAQHAFNTLFAEPFDGAAVTQYEASAAAQLQIQDEGDRRDTRARRLRVAAWSAWGTAGAAAIVAGVLELSARSLHDVPMTDTQVQTVARNQEIATRNHVAIGLAIGAGVAAATGLVFWNAARQATVGAAVTPDGASVSLAFRF